MDAASFDSLARSLATGSRRRLLRLLAGGVAAAALGLPRLAAPDRAGAQTGDICSPGDDECV